MSRKVEFEIQCSCNRFFKGKGRGVRGEDIAWRSATDKYLSHIREMGTTRIIDTGTPEGLLEAAVTVVRLVNEMPIS